MKTLSYCLSLLLLTIGIAAAQSDNTPPPDKGPHRYGMRMPGMGMAGMPGLGHDWWRNSEIAQAINLNDAQKQQLNDIFSSHRANLIQAKGNVELEEGKLHDLLEQDKPQQDQVLAEMTQLQNARNSMEKEFTIMSLASMISKRRSQPIGRRSDDGRKRRSHCDRVPGSCTGVGKNRKPRHPQSCRTNCQHYREPALRKEERRARVA